ncbi:serine/threonine protein kinase [Candidatus Magnetomorum sp. HK-1]|nr:serine/threonine protein kinase [Candidatus Magnetomorum sp. HK-1]
MKYLSTLIAFLIIPGFISAQEIFHPADTNEDKKISSQEFDAYNKAWQKNQSWNNSSKNIQVDDVTRAGYLFSFGEDYYYDENETGTLQWKSKKAMITNSIGMNFVYIHPGTFIMGSPPDEPGRETDETRHVVTLTNGYFIQTTEITQGQWKEIMGNNPSVFNTCGDNCPVENITWNNVQSFIDKLNQKEGTDKYRLPTEAEWEYAARAGTTTAIPNGQMIETSCEYDSNMDEMGWYCGNADKTHPVAQKKPNKWWLFDMHGNVWEFCQDWYDSYPVDPVVNPVGPGSGPYRVLRGGSWRSPGANSSRSASRHNISSKSYYNNVGARLVYNVQNDQ